MSKKVCKGITAEGKQCTAPTIKHAFNKDTGKKYNTDYCQMHQPGKISKSCKCPHCVYHVALKSDYKTNLKKYKNTKLRLTKEQREKYII